MMKKEQNKNKDRGITVQVSWKNALCGLIDGFYPD